MRPEIAIGAFRIGAYAKNVTSATSDGEAGLNLGATARVAGFDLSATAAWKRAIDAIPGSDRDAIELTRSAARRFGRVTLRANLVWSPDNIGGTGRSFYVESSASYAVGEARFLHALNFWFKASLPLLLGGCAAAGLVLRGLIGI